MKKLLLLALCLLPLYQVSAQQQQKTVKYARDLTLGTVVGEASFSYITRDDGLNVPDGNATVKAKGHREVSGLLYHGAVDITFNMNASFSKGLMNGPASSVCKVIFEATVIYDSEQSNEQCTFSGYFRNGIPDGHFKVYSDITNGNGEYDLLGDIKLEANYTRGILTGAYEYMGPDDLGRNAVSTSVKGQLDSKGRLTGKWSIYRMGNMDYEFLNGVMLNKSTESYSTTPYQKEISTKYAKGELTREDVYNMGFAIKTDSLHLGNYARIAIIFARDGFDFSQFKGYDFTIENNPKYEYLVETPVLSKEGADYLIGAIKKWLAYNIKDDALGYTYDYNIYGYILPQNGEYKIEANKRSGFSKYLKNPASVASKIGSFDAYINPEEMNYIDSVMDAYLASASVSPAKCIFGSDNATAESAIEKIRSQSKDRTQYIASLSEYAKNISSFLDNIVSHRLSDKYSYIENENRTGNKIVMKTSSLSGLDSAANGIITLCRQETAKYFLEKSFNFITENKKAFNIVWFPKEGYSSSYFYSKDDDPSWQTNLEKRLKLFGNIKGYEIVSIDTQDNTVTCNLTRSGKKKKDPDITSQITIEFKASAPGSTDPDNTYMLCVESFDITRAKKL